MKLINLADAYPLLGKPWLGPLVERVLAVDQFNTFYRGSQQRDPDIPFMKRCLDELEVDYEINGSPHLEDLMQGSALVVANHPFGGVESLVISHIIRQIRPDAKVLVNYLLARVPEVNPWVIPVDPFERETSVRANLSAMRQAIRHVKDGGVLVMFPAGAVSHFHWRHARVTDPAWSPHMASIAQRTQAPILPIYFHGSNGPLFQTLGAIHPMMRTACLCRELMNKRGRTVELTVGKALRPVQWQRFEDKDRLTAFVRASTYLLKKPPETEEEHPLAEDHQTAIAEAVDTNILATEVASMPSESKLATQRGFEVYLTTRQQSPNIVLEIGRLREITFREIGEGSGKARDLDDFDDHYEHLFLWSPDECAIIGAYRLIRVDEVLRERGQAGLYTATLYKFKQDFLKRLGSALELGRSFIVSRHQKQRHSLMLLWCGIGAYVVRHPQYHTLFGPVSMSQDYTNLSKQLLVWFIRKSFRHPVLSRLVQANNPFKGQAHLRGRTEWISECVQSIDDVSALMSGFEQDGKGVPVLFKQYLKMNALLLSFSVDAEFSNVLDGLLLADLRTADSKILRRYFGDEGLKVFRDFHEPEGTEASDILSVSAD